MIFAKLVKSRRELLCLSSRDLANQLGLKPSDWNRIERAVQLPPKTHEFALELASALMIEENSTEYVELVNALRAASLRERPLLSDEQLLSRLPIIFRTKDGKKPSKTELGRLAEKLRYELS